MELINRKYYPLWSQFVEKKEEWIGGTLEDFGDSMDQIIFGPKTSKTTIKDISLLPNGTESAFFRVDGDDWGCGFDVKVGGIIAGEEGWITFSGYLEHKWRIKKKS